MQAELWNSCINDYLTFRKFLGHTNACKLQNSWHPLEKKKNMMPSTEECSRNNPPPPKQVSKPTPMARSSNSNMKKQPQAQNKGKGKAPQTHTARATESQRYKIIPWKMCFRLPEL
ncbi:hypothetical protein O181_118604 [Austropuccinia psidii MF-1]|uniref:Uncharacterized protein n=1 Tax=Austropuccinia psidii MF-1 TaxID=1389203 RepID=A0A9Q3KFL2_9BASI|nr:hypothetical protein [Austropuccinia psidii MF-1]